MPGLALIFSDTPAVFLDSALDLSIRIPIRSAALELWTSNLFFLVGIGSSINKDN